jgi:hypothetical protein
VKWAPGARRINGLAAKPPAVKNSAMIHPSKVVSIHPYFKIQAGKLPEAQAILKRLVAKAAAEPGNLYYDFTLNGDVVFCREAYNGAEGMLLHLDNVGPELGEFLKIASVLRVELHASAENLAKLRGPLAALKPECFEFFDGAVR